MKKILLIHPKSPDTFWQLTGTLEITKRKAVMPPLGLATVAALTPTNYEIEIQDEEIQEIDYDTSCDMVGITGYTLHSERMFAIAAEFRKRGILTIGGGPYCTGHSHECRDHFDVLICGEAEHIWPEFLSDYEKGSHKDFYLEKEKIHMPDSPIPRWDLVPLQHYSASLIQTSRGCPYDCEFCDVVSLFGRKMRYKGYDQIIAEVKLLSDLGRHDIFMADDNFVGNKSFVRVLLQKLIDFNKSIRKPIRYATQLTLNIANDEEMLDLFKEANFYCFFIGIESPKEESLMITNKAHNAKLDMKESIRRIQSRGIFIISGMIVGFDTDDNDIFQLQKDFLQDTGLVIPMLGMLIAPKGTNLWDRLEKENRLYPNLEAGDMFSVTNFEPKLMNREYLQDNYLKLLKEVFSVELFKERFEKMLDQVDLPRVKKNSPLSRMMQVSNMRLYNIKVTFKIIFYYLFNKSKEKRKLFRSLLVKVFRKGLVTFPWLIELLLYFKAENDFVVEHNIGYSVEKSPDSSPEKRENQLPVLK